MDASKALGLYVLDDNAPKSFKDKTILLVFEAEHELLNNPVVGTKTDRIVTKILTDWMAKDESIKIEENKGLISRISDVPIILN